MEATNTDQKKLSWAWKDMTPFVRSRVKGFLCTFQGPFLQFVDYKVREWMNECLNAWWLNVPRLRGGQRKRGGCEPLLGFMFILISHSQAQANRMIPRLRPSSYQLVFDYKLKICCCAKFVRNQSFCGEIRFSFGQRVSRTQAFPCVTAPDRVAKRKGLLMWNTKAWGQKGHAS